MIRGQSHGGEWTWSLVCLPRRMDGTLTEFTMSQLQDL